MVSQELLNKLKVIMTEDYRINLTNDELLGVANMLVTFFGLLAKIDSES